MLDSIIISDLHLGLNNKNCGELFNLITERKSKRLILLGDILEKGNLNILSENELEFLKKLEIISKEMEIIWVVGNHDLKLLQSREFSRVPVYETYKWIVNEKKFMAIHGHQFQKNVFKNKLIEGILVVFYHLFLSLRLYGLIKFTKKMSFWSHFSRKIEVGAFSYAKKMNVDGIFCGHTHIPMQKTNEGISYWNTGSWIENPQTLVEINENGEVKILHFKI